MTLTEQKKALVDFLQIAIERNDWHMVSDLANDLRELEVEIRLGSQPIMTYPSIDAFGLPVINYEGAKK